MIFLIHSETAEGTVDANLGLPEYSYYFVLKAFRPLLEEMGVTIAIADPEHEVDRICRNARQHGEDCVFLTFSPPHRTYVATECPTIPIFAWEFDTIPVEAWNGEPRHDWRLVLRQTGRAITHSQFAVQTVRRDLGKAYDIISLPAPVWDGYAPLYAPQRLLSAPGQARSLTVRGRVYDSRKIDFSQYVPLVCPKYARADLPEGAGKRDSVQQVTLDGVIYTSVLCPLDARKNWFDMISAFCWSLRDCADATLVLKLTHRECDEAIGGMLKDLAKLMPFSCRIVIIDGYLPDSAYQDLAAASHYALNTSHGEGQCLPLMEYMSAGKPAITPLHTSMEDYVTAQNAFIVKSHHEPTAWPHDPRQLYKTRRHRIDFESLLAALRDSYDTAKADPARYARMAQAAHEDLRVHCSRAVIKSRLTGFLAPHSTMALTA
jgi:glycosyltransferase involved in cell wall biosynthesis